jgi:hypothetical protein
MSTLTRASADPARIRGLIAAHRHAQAEHRGALAAESAHALAAAEHRGQAVLDALRRCGAHELATHLQDEARAGVGLIVALTSDDTTSDQVHHAITAYLSGCASVDHHGRAVAGAAED